jgi:multidrug efflux pump subunit AcrB
MTGFNLSEWALKHKSFVVYLMLMFTAAGLGSYYSLGRDEDPPFTIRTMTVSAKWPGASTEDMIDQVTDRLEKKLQEMPSLDFIRSFTKPGETTIYVNLLDATPSSVLPEMWYQVRKKIADIRQTLPPGVEGPVFNDEFGDTFGIIYAFTADGFSRRELNDHIEFMRSQLLRIPNVEKINFIGVQREEIHIEYSTKLLASMGIDPRQVARVLREQNAVIPSGALQTDTDQVKMLVSGEFESEDDLRAITLRANDRYYRLADIVKITRGYVDPPTPSFRFDGKPAYGLAISMRKGGDVLKLGEAVRHRMAELEADTPVGLDAHLVSDQPVVVEESVHGFTKTLMEAVVIVLGISFLSLGLRAGLVVALCIPLTLVVTFACMEALGIDLQRISLGALIIALGLLVDDAMITVEMMVAKLEEGMDLLHSATFAYTATAFPMLTGTLVTIAGFLPIAFAKSGAGEYTFSLFEVVGISLVVSWFVAVLFAPLIGVTILPKTMKKHGHAEGRLMRAERGMLIQCIRHRWLTIAVTLAIFAVSLYGTKFLEKQFFPASDRPEVLVDLTLPKGASIEATTAQVDRFEKLLAGDPNIDRWSTYVGQGAIRFYLPLDVQAPNPYFAQIVIVAKGFDERDAVMTRLNRVFNEGFEELLGRVQPLGLGPPVSWPVEYRVSGDDPEEVRRLAYRVAEAVHGNPNAGHVNFNWIEMSRTVRIQVNQDKARLLGISSEALSRAINSVVAGQTITQMRDSIYLIDVVARASADERASLTTLRDLKITLDNGQSIPLADVARLEYGLEDPLIWRRNRLPTITVQADLAGKAQAATVVDQLAPKMAALQATLPPGYRIEVGGTVEATAKGQNPVIAVVPMMLIVMVTTVMIQLQSMQRTFLVFSVAPMGVIGVVGALLPSHTPMGFVAILGIVALAGMIVRNSVILITQIETEIEAGHHPWNAVIDATMHRTRPILLTAAAAIMGMIPISRELFWGPMAFAVMGGLVSATVLTLWFLPALYVVWFRVREPKVDSEKAVVFEHAEAAS